MVVEEFDDLEHMDGKEEEGEERRCHGQTHTLFIIVIISDYSLAMGLVASCT